MNWRRYADHPFWQAAALLVAAYVVIVYVVPLFPGSALVPKSVCCSTWPPCSWAC